MSHPHLGLAPLFCVLTLFAGAARAQLGVASVSPARNSLGASNAGAISITFTTAVQTASVTSATCMVFGRWSGVMDGTFSFENGNRRVVFEPARPFFPGEMVTVMASSGIRSSAGSLTRGYAWSFWTGVAPGSGNFTPAGRVTVRLPGETGIMTYGAYAGDLDRDGSPDLSVPNEAVDDVRVFLNSGCGSFSGTPSLHAVPPSSKPSTNEGADFNADGLTDLAVGNIGSKSFSVFFGDGAGSYRPAVSYATGNGTRGLAVLDVDADGDTDIVTANRFSSNLALHRNAGDGTFSAAAFFDGGGDGETGVAAADADNDGVMDLFVINHTSGTATVLLGDGAGGFTLSATRPVDGQPWMLAVGEIDGDGNVDVATANSTKNRASVVRGDGAGGLLPAVNYTVGAFPIAADLGDLEGDGDLDLIVSNHASADFTVYINDGTGQLGSPFTLPAPQAGSCALVVDYDRDGDVDILGIDELEDVILMFRQTGPALAGVQPPDCKVTLRIDNLANRGGYGGSAPPHAVPIGGRFLIGVSAGPQLPFAVVLGFQLAPGLPLSLGILNVTPIASLPLQTTNAQGEALITLPVPAGVSPGIQVALQALVIVPGNPDLQGLSNPELVELR